MPSPGRWGHPPVPSQGWGPSGGPVQQASRYPDRQRRAAQTRTQQASATGITHAVTRPLGSPLSALTRMGPFPEASATRITHTVTRPLGSPPVPSQGWGPSGGPSPASKPLPGPPTPGGPDSDSVSFRHRDNPCRHPAAGVTPQCPHKDGAFPGAQASKQSATRIANVGQPIPRLGKASASGVTHAVTRPLGPPPSALTRMGPSPGPAAPPPPGLSMPSPGRRGEPPQAPSQGWLSFRSTRAGHLTGTRTSATRLGSCWTRLGSAQVDSTSDHSASSKTKIALPASSG
jgi:hypothetical protein